MPITVRRARKQDSRHIVNIINRAFDEPASLEQVQYCIQNTGFRTYVAELENRVIGFVSGFITTGIDGTKRSELDLQAVHPDYQGQGAGKKLIQRFTKDETQADYIRALIRVGNTPMEKALTRMGFTTDDVVCGLYVSSQSDVESCHSTPVSEGDIDSFMIPVTTMTYTGIWLEGKIDIQAIHAGFSACQNVQDIVGAVVPETDKSAIKALQSANFNLVNSYHWLQLEKLTTNH